MQRYILVRFLQALIAVFVLFTVVFVISRLSGDPVSRLLPADAPPGAYDDMRKSLGLDKPYVVQYGSFIAKATRGDFGKSLKSRRPVSDLVRERLPNSVKLAAAALAITMLL